jgi:hypothetical protein
MYEQTNDGAEVVVVDGAREEQGREDAWIEAMVDEGERLAGEPGDRW